MTVEDLIEKLKYLSPESEVRVGTVFGLLKINSISVRDNHVQLTTY